MNSDSSGRRKRLLVVFLAGIFTVLAVYVVVFNKKHRDPQDEDAIALSASALYSSLYTNSSRDYLNKTIEVTGLLKEIIPEGETAGCALAVPENEAAAVRISVPDQHRDDLTKLRIGETATFRGICTGVLADTVMEGIVSVDIRLRDGSLARR